MKNKNGFSLVELLVSIIVASILILTIGVLSSIANSSFNKINSEQQTYNDISYGFKLMQNKVRSASLMSQVAKPAGTDWRSDKLVVDTAEFGIYRNGSSRDFVFIPDKSNENNREKILSVPDSNDSDSNLSMAITAISAQSVSITLSGQKDKVPFDMETTVVKRN